MRTTPSVAERAAAAALARLEQDGPLAGHPAHRSRWRAVAAREQVDSRMGER